ncbi:MAG: magnesium/cobalt transporter CorA [Myxococcota bacterium]
MSRKPKRHPKVGLPPGSAVYVGTPREGGAHLSAFVYDSHGIVEHTHPTPGEIHDLVKPNRVVWLDCDGVHDVAIVTEICTRFGVHPLALEDVLNTESRPKLDLYENGIAVIALDMVAAEGSPCELLREHVTIVAGVGFVLSFQEGTRGDLFDPVRQRIRVGAGRIRTMGADYLLHALLDAVVDGYFVVIDRMEERIDGIEADALDSRAVAVPKQVYAAKSDLGVVRHAVFPLREVVSRLLLGEAPIVTRAVEPYLRDLADHVMSVLDLVEADRERLTGVLELHLAVATHRMNDVMKVLTIVATVFMPLSWVAGVYGMNFDHMPELHWMFGYPFAMAVMIGMALLMLGYFKLRGWF